MKKPKPAQSGSLERRVRRLCSCAFHPIYGIEVDHFCQLHGDRCEHGKLPDEECVACESPNKLLSEPPEISE